MNTALLDTLRLDHKQLGQSVWSSFGSTIGKMLGANQDERSLAVMNDVGNSLCELFSAIILHHPELALNFDFEALNASQQVEQFNVKKPRRKRGAEVAQQPEGHLPALMSGTGAVLTKGELFHRRL